jgi:hypothetical protein
MEKCNSGRPSEEYQVALKCGTLNTEECEALFQLQGMMIDENSEKPVVSG